MRIHRSIAVLVLLGLAITAAIPPTGRAGAAAAAPTYQAGEQPAQAAEPPPGEAYTDIGPDDTCASGYTAFVVAHGVRECYTPDPVVENQNLQGTCPTDPSLYICPGQAD